MGRFLEGKKKTGGRQKGVPNKRSFDAQKLAEDLGVDPLEILLHAASNNYSALGYESAITTKLVGENAITEDTIPVQLRVQAAKEAAQYLYAKRKAIELKGDDGENLFVQMLMNARSRIEEK